MTKSDKKITTVYVSEKLIERAKAEGINISEVLNNVLRELLSNRLELKLKEVEEEMQQLRERLTALELQRQELLKHKEKELTKKEREAELYKLMSEYSRLQEKYRRAATDEEIETVRKQLSRVRQSILSMTHIPAGSELHVRVFRLLHAGEVDKAHEMVKNLIKD